MRLMIIVISHDSSSMAALFAMYFPIVSPVASSQSSGPWTFGMVGYYWGTEGIDNVLGRDNALM